ncbi:MAG: GHKL domain-containing protein [Lachnospiraceae bacterium]|nr:GHKL domain-containing protein [Lachnospiraceae bacterium]
MGFVNLINVLFIFTTLKVLTHLPYIRIIIACYLAELFGMFAIVLPYNLVLYLATRNTGAVNIFETPPNLYTIVGILLALLLILLNKKIVHRWFHNFSKWTIRCQPGWWVMLVLFYGFSLLFYNADNAFTTSRYAIFCVAEMLFGVLTLYFVSWLMRRRDSRRLQQENRILTVENTFMKEYYHTLTNQMDYTRKFHHDITKHMDILKELTANVDVDRRILDYAKELETAFHQITPLSYCKNPVYNAILVNKVKQCEEKQISFRIEMQHFDTGKIKEIDMVALLANLLDNAIEECDRLPDTTQKQMQIRSDMQKNNLFIQVCNSSQLNTPDILTAKTKKPDAYAHGVGTTIIQEIIEKYNGTMTSAFHNDILEILIQFPLE